MDTEKVRRDMSTVLGSKATEVFDGTIDTRRLREIFSSLLDEHNKGFQVNMSWDQPEAYDQWYTAFAAVERLMED